MRCEHCGGELVQVDNPMRPEFRHRRGVACSGMPRPPAQPGRGEPETPGTGSDTSKRQRASQSAKNEEGSCTEGGTDAPSAS